MLYRSNLLILNHQLHFLLLSCNAIINSYSTCLGDGNMHYILSLILILFELQKQNSVNIFIFYSVTFHSMPLFDVQMPSKLLGVYAMPLRRYRSSTYFTEIITFYFSANKNCLFFAWKSGSQPLLSRWMEERHVHPKPEHVFHRAN